MKKQKIAIIIPTIRENSLKKFLKQWQKELEIVSPKYDVCLYVIEDNPETTFTIDKKFLLPLKHYSWKDVTEKLGKDSWIIPRRSDAIRSFGVLLAYKNNCDYFITLDDDCYPYDNETNTPGYFIETHTKNLSNYEHMESVWTNSMNGLKPRGYPFFDTAVKKRVTNAAISHGLWVNVPDFDSITQLSLSKKDQYFEHVKNQIIPNGTFFPMSSMNLAWNREVAPLMYFLLMGQDERNNKYDYDRFGDIWCGLIVKKIVDYLGLTTISGDPCVNHERASNPLENLQKEAPGIKQNEVLWRDIYEIQLTKSTVKELYQELARKLPTYSPYWEKLKKAMLVWSDLF